uniref:Uncharacterized protein n=1 Tax=Rhodopseudomonas palustris (strain BisA53) TaxID=316055 RepID=Q07TN4_RHOP5
MGTIVSGKSATLQWILVLLKVAGAGLTTGLITPLLQLAIDRIDVPPGGFRVALMAVPFAVLVSALVWRAGRRWWTALLAALITMVAFVCAVNSAILVDSLSFDAGKTIRNALAGFAGGFVGAALMALGLTPLPGIRAAWGPWAVMVAFGTLAGALLALDHAVGFDVFSFLFPVWQSVVGVCLAVALHRR